MSERDQLEAFWSGDDDTLGYTEDEIRDYLSGKMTGADLDEFKFSLSETPELQVHVAALRHEMEIERRQAEAKRVAAARAATVVEPARKEKRWSFATWSGLGFAALGGIFMVVAFMSLSQQQGLAKLEKEVKRRELALKNELDNLKSDRQKLDGDLLALREKTSQVDALAAKAKADIDAADQKVSEAVRNALTIAGSDAQRFAKGDGQTASGDMQAWYVADPAPSKPIEGKSFLLKWKTKPAGLKVSISVRPRGGPSLFSAEGVTSGEVLIDLKEMPVGSRLAFYEWTLTPVDRRFDPVTGLIVRIATSSE